MAEDIAKLGLADSDLYLGSAQIWPQNADLRFRTLNDPAAGAGPSSP